MGQRYTHFCRYENHLSNFAQKLGIGQLDDEPQCNEQHMEKKSEHVHCILHGNFVV